MMYEVFQRQNPSLGRIQWFWHLKSANGNVLTGSPGGYDDLKQCYSGIRRGKGAATATVLNLVTGNPM